MKMKNVWGLTPDEWYQEILPYDTNIKFKLSIDSTVFYGRVVGISYNDVPFGGKSYIIELPKDSELRKEYPYSCISVPEIYIIKA